MTPRYETTVTLDDGEVVLGRVMYLIVWEGKALSGGERLIKGDEIVTMTVDATDV